MPARRPAPPIAGTPIPARRLPKVRERLARFWAGDKVRERLLQGAEARYDRYLPFADMYPNMHAAIAQTGERQRVVAGPVRHVDPEVADRFCTRMRHSIAAADLYWISEEFTDLAVASAAKLPDMAIRREDLPAPHGLLMFATPFTTVSTPNLVARATAVGWCLLDGGVWLTVYGRPEHIDTASRADVERLRSITGPLWPLAPGAGAPFNDTLSFHDEGSRRCWGPVFAAWLLTAQPNLTAPALEPAERDHARSYARAHGGHSPDPVRVYDLRQRVRSAQPREPGNEETGRKLGVRSIVGAAEGGFWRDQAYGPKWSLRRRQWIMPFMRGPADAPLKTEAVEIVRRLQ